MNIKFDPNGNTKLSLTQSGNRRAGFSRPVFIPVTEYQHYIKNFISLIFVSGLDN